MNEQLENNAGIADTIDMLAKHVLAIWRFRWFMVLAAVLISVIGWPLVMVVPNKYESSTKIYVDTKTMLKPVLKGLAVDSDIAVEFADITRRTILNTNNLERIMREADLDIAVQHQRERERLLAHLKDTINISSFGGNKKRGEIDNFYTISFTHSNPRTAHTVVQSVLDIFIESSLGATRKDSTLTESFLNEQIAEYERRLFEAEQALKEFKQANINIMPGQAGGYFKQYSDAKEKLRSARLELKESEEREKKLTEQLDQFVSGRSQYAVDFKNAELDERISEMQRKLDELLLTYTNEHPNVVAVSQAISQLEEKKQNLTTAKSVSASDVAENKLFQDLKVAQSNAAANVSALTVRVSEYEREVQRLRGLIDTIPDIEAKLAQLNRDYEVNKEKYNSLLSRRESANISKQAEVSSDQVLFKVIEPPKVPITPLSPNRPLLLVAVYFLSLALGGGLAWLIAQLKPAVMSVKELRNGYGVAVLGSVSVVMSEAQRQYERRKLIMLLGVLAIHFVVAALLVASQYLYDDPLGIIKQIV